MLLLDFIGALSPLSHLPYLSLAAGVLLSWGGPEEDTMERRAFGNWAVVLLRGGWGREKTGSHS